MLPLPLEAGIDVVHEVERAVQDDAAIGLPVASWRQQRQNRRFRLAGQRVQPLKIAIIEPVAKSPFVEFLLDGMGAESVEASSCIDPSVG